MKHFFGKNLKYLREKKGLSQNKLSEKINVSQTTIARWEDENRIPIIDNAVDVAEALNIDLPDLLFKDLTIENAKIIELPTNTIRIPVLGRIPAGIPIEAIEDIIGDEEIPTEWTKGDKKWFGFEVNETNMSPEYKKKDIIIVLQQQECESGQDCVVMVNGDDATFRRVIKQGDSIILKSLNNEYDPINFNYNEIVSKPVKILGIAKEVRRKL